jgi:prevent-host-death family protein
MHTVSVSELKAMLSQYLSKVKSGDKLIITDCGKPLAMIVPMRRLEMNIPRRLLNLERAGLARIGKASVPSDFWTLPRPKDRKNLTLKYMLNERDERR